MEKRISKSFNSIFSNLYPNFDQNEAKNSEEYFNFIIENYPDKSEINQLKGFFLIFSLGIRKLFVKDKNIPQYINNLQSSNISLFRKLGSGITALFGLSTARSLNGEGSVYKHFDYPIYKNGKIEKKDNEIPESIEVAVIGSGSGGGVAVNILNEKYEVGIFEKGSFANGETNNETFGYHNFYETFAIQQTRGYKVLLLAGNGVGGGTSINWTTSLRTPDNILSEWDALTGQNNYFNSSEFKNSIDYVCSQLNVSEDNNTIPQKEVKLAEGLKLNNVNYKIIPRNTSNDQCLENGHINVEKDGNLQEIAVKKVILAASSLNTPKILLNSGYKNKHLGQHLKLHPVSGVAGKFSEEQKPWAGTMQGIYSDDNLFMKDNYGYLLEGLPMHPSLFFPFFPNNQDNFGDFIKSYNQWSGGIVLTSDTSSGSIINKNPQHLWDYNLNNFDHSNLLHGIESLVRANYLAGAEEIMVAASPTMHWKKSSNENIDDFVNKIKAIKNEPFRMLLGSAHQMGTARINPNPEHGVVDLDGKVHGLENVYIVDASTFPRCSGVNPMISIQSMSHFLMSKI